MNWIKIHKFLKKAQDIFRTMILFSNCRFTKLLRNLKKVSFLCEKFLENSSFLAA